MRFAVILFRRKRQTNERDYQKYAEQNERTDDLIAGKTHNRKFKIY